MEASKSQGPHHTSSVELSKWIFMKALGAGWAGQCREMQSIPGIRPEFTPTLSSAHRIAPPGPSLLYLELSPETSHGDLPAGPSGKGGRGLGQRECLLSHHTEGKRKI